MSPQTHRLLEIKARFLRHGRLRHVFF
jgi:hypothetical protein